MEHAEWRQAINSCCDPHKCVAVKEGRKKTQKQTNNALDANYRQPPSFPSVVLMCEQMIASSKDRPVILDA